MVVVRGRDGGLIDVVCRKISANDDLRLRLLNNVKKLAGKEGRIPRIDQVLRVGFRHGTGIHSMLELVKKAAEGMYHPKGFDEEDDLQALLFLCLGGAQVADIAHRIFGTPSVSMIRTRTSVPQICPSPSFPTHYEIEHNISASFKGLLNVLGVLANNQLHAVVIKATGRQNANANAMRLGMTSQTKILGVCREHGCGTSLEFTSEEDLQTLWEELARGKIHLAHEATVGVIAVLSSSLRLYSTCKREMAENHATLLQTVVNAANGKKDLTGLRIVSLASDGESRRGKALAKLMYVAPLAPSSPIYDQLVHLDLFDRFVGADDITADKDYKHIFKWLRNSLLREKGCVVHSVKLMRGLIRKHLQDSGHSNAYIEYILDPTDKQDVLLTYTLLKDLWCLPLADPESSSQPIPCEAWHFDFAVWAFAGSSYHLIFPYICVELSLSEQLEHLSAAMHLVLALYVHGDAKTLFIPTTLLVDIGIMVKNVFFFSFGILRTMVGNDANLDILQLSLRITGTTEVSNILAKHPEWDKSPRRLCLPTVSKNMEVFPASADHTGPRAYLHPERLYPSGLTLATTWKRGRRLMEDKYPWITPILSRISMTQNASILAPYGSTLITFSTTDDDDTVTEEHTPPSQVDGSSLTPNVRDTTIGIRELEDAAAEAQWCKNQSSFSDTIKIGGVAVNKSRAIAQQFRLRHVAQESRFKHTGGLGISDSGNANTDGPLLCILQPIATLVFCEQKLFLCIAEVNELFLDCEPVDEIPLSVLQEKITQVSYQALRLVPASYSDDPDGTNDWRTSNLFSLTAKVPGALVQPINPVVASHNLCDTFFLFESSVLMAIAASLQDRVARGHRKAIPHVKKSDYFPYQEQDGTSLIY
ncbi:hypothetical protein BC826DRAFT_1093772 [Russula brevipes]|nr:hypothetical protein BC826DRAFT_1093772 [Russula brevipes]